MVRLTPHDHPTARLIQSKARARALKATHANRLHRARINAAFLAPMTETERRWFGRAASTQATETLAREPWLGYPVRTLSLAPEIERSVQATPGDRAMARIRAAVARVFGRAGAVQGTP